MRSLSSCCPGCGTLVTLAGDGHGAPGVTATRRGSFIRGDGRPVPRYQCKLCRRHFSSQTFRDDYRRRRSHLDAALARLLRAGFSVRATARLLGVARRTVQRRVGDRVAGCSAASGQESCAARTGSARREGTA